MRRNQGLGNTIVGWYYLADKDSFGGIFYHDDEEEAPSWRAGGMNPHGPFESFSEAKKDALAYYRADVTIARANIQDVLCYRKPTAGLLLDHKGEE